MELNLSAWSKVVSNSSFKTYQQKVSLIGNRVQNVIIPPAELIIINRWSRAGRSVSTPSPRGYIFCLLGKNAKTDETAPSISDSAGSGDGGCLRLAQVLVGAELLAVEHEQKRGSQKHIAKESSETWSTVRDKARHGAHEQRFFHQKVGEVLFQALAKEDVRPPIFDYDELKAATKDFSQHNELGKCAFGAVYKVSLSLKQI
ncbi:hypothetical protein R1flu_003333 [Riccia fluitans]|uniref:Uncharacterized protein n=1 Tax=Riccia fluitans TaxID=41844 RepID=A0ABD1Y8Q3_9MARC